MAMLSMLLRRTPLLARPSSLAGMFSKVLANICFVILGRSPVAQVRLASSQASEKIRVYVNDIPVYCEPETTVLQVRERERDSWRNGEK